MCHCCRQFTAGRGHGYDERSRKPSIITDGLVEFVRERIMKNSCFTITELSSYFPLPVAKKLSRRSGSENCAPGGCQNAWCSGIDGAFSPSTSWTEVRRWILSVTAKHCTNYDGPFRTSGAGCLVPVLCCSTITLGHTRPTHLLQEFSCEVFNHPPYSPDLAPRELHFLNVYWIWRFWVKYVCIFKILGRVNISGHWRP